MMQFLKKIELK